MKQNRELLLLVLGPVQGFIATARRTQDLAVGSRILSLLAQAAVDAVPQLECEVIYPRYSSAAAPPSLPNRVVINAPVGQGATVAEQMEQAIRQRWAKISGDVYSDLSGCVRHVPEHSWSARWSEQLATWLECYWIVSPWDGDDATYGAAYQQASMVLEARKNLRYIPATMQPGEKCTLCGTRSALTVLPEFWQVLRRRVGFSRLRANEQLCAVCATKRFAALWATGLQLERYPSTSSIASADFRAAVLQHWPQLATLAVAHLDALDQLGVREYSTLEPSPYLQALAHGDPDKERFLRYDGDYFYREFFTPEQVADHLSVEELTPQQHEWLQAAIKTLIALYHQTRQLGIAPPAPYYATLALDGDRMGRLLDAMPTLAKHQEISSALADLAAGPLRQVIEVQCPGQVIYAGGDDVLALLPLSAALTAAETVKRTLTTRLQSLGYACTASAGIALVHHLQPLDVALRAAKEAEHAAKESYGRNALAIISLRRSGEERRTGRKWPRNEDIVDLLRDWMATEKLSGKFAYELADEASALGAVPFEMQQQELLRLLKRHTDFRVWHALTGLTRQSVMAELSTAASQLLSTVHPETGAIAEIANLEALSVWLVIARFLAQGGQA